MPSAFIVKRGEGPKRRFVVRYRLGGRAWPIQHGGSFKTDKEARARRDLVAGELAAGRNPAEACGLRRPADAHVHDVGGAIPQRRGSTST